MAEKKIVLENVDKYYTINGKTNQILKDINLEIKPGEFISILGHSGCGKSTLIRIIAGLEEEYNGEIYLGDEILHEPDTRRGMVFQDHRLLPWQTLYENLSFGFYEKDKKKKKSMITKYLKMVGLEHYENAYPSQISGGMSQRASIARALLHNPEVLLLDEPFGALDALTRMQMQEEVMRIWRQEQTTMVLVTHDIDEAIYLSDRIIILEGKPATIKCTIDVPMGRTRQRTSPDFSQIRSKVYREFFGEEEILQDYQI